MRIAGCEVVGLSAPIRAQDLPFSDQREPDGQRHMRFGSGDPMERRPDRQEIGLGMREVAARRDAGYDEVSTLDRALLKQDGVISP